MKAASVIPRRDNRRRAILVEKEINQLVFRLFGFDDERAAVPSPAQARIELFSDEAQDAEGFQIVNQGVRRTARERDAVHAWFSVRVF